LAEVESAAERAALAAHQREASLQQALDAGRARLAELDVTAQRVQQQLDLADTVRLELGSERTMRSQENVALREALERTREELRAATADVRPVTVRVESD
jgi:hypothetical protein